MNERQIVRHVRTMLEHALPDAPEYTVRLWFCRLCALCCLMENQLLPPAHDEAAMLSRMTDARHFFPGIRLFHDDLPSPSCLLPAMQFLRQLPPSAWRGHPELPGWLYQYYNMPEREAVTDRIHRSRKVSAAHLPAATQLFTPDWIVRYMVQNALGTLLSPLPDWQYYLPPAQPQPVCKTPDAITVLDPCMGTGHILAYVFDALMAQFLSIGWHPETAAVHILTRSLCGMDIDRGAVLTAEFVLYMKAAAIAPRLARQVLPMQLYDFTALEQTVPHASLFGSLLRQQPCGDGTVRKLTEALSARYDAVITNPPYLGSSGMDPRLSAFVRTQYPAGKADLFAAFMERCAELTSPAGCFSMITQHAWMFLSSYRELRERMCRCTLQSMVHLGAKAFSLTDVGTIVQVTAFTAFGRQIPGFRTTYLRLTEQDDKETAFFDPSLRYVCTAERFADLPGRPLCYWMSDRMREAMRPPLLGDSCRICQGMTTSDNKRFLRRWYEVPPGSIAFGCRNAEEAAASGKTWFPYNKGGRLRRWYGNHSYVVNYANNGEELREFHAEIRKAHAGGRLKNADMYFRPAVTWSFITDSTRFGVRFQPEGFLFDVSGSCLFPAQEDLLYVMGLLSSETVLEMLKLYNPTMNFQAENLKNLPLRIAPHRRAEVEALVRENLRIAREDWDSTEESWDFTVHPLLQTGAATLSEAYARYAAQCEVRRDTMQRNERELSRIFAEIYGLAQELPGTVPAPTLLRPDPTDAARSLVSYVVGCLFGRYRREGIPVLPDNFLPPDALPQYLSAFLETAFGRETLAEDLAWLETALGEPLTRYCRMDLYPDHCRRFHKRPIYWLATSGWKREVCGLVYIHRMPQFPAAELCRIAGEQPPSPERDAYLTRLEAMSDTAYVPDDGVHANHSRFRSIFAAIR